MSFLRNLTKILVTCQGNTRAISLTHLRKQSGGPEFQHGSEEWVVEDPKDRSVEIDVETSIRYLNSEAFKKTYGGQLIWTLYRRNKTRHFLGETRKKCIRNNIITTASPCPVCRDMYLVLDYRNIKLLEQFISPYSGEILPSKKTGLCQMQQERLIVSVIKAKEYGTLSYHVPFRYYDYNYYKELADKFLEENKASKH